MVVRALALMALVGCGRIAFDPIGDSGSGGDDDGGLIPDDGGFTGATAVYIKASNTGATDFFSRLALSGDGKTLAVGSAGESSAATGINGNEADNGASSAGAVYVFTRGSSGWSQQAYLKASNTDAVDGFGSGLAISADGNTLAVGAAGESSNAIGIDGNQADNSRLSSGAIYVFSRAGAVWTQQAYIKTSNPDTGDFVGNTLSLSSNGDTLAVGVSSEDGDGSSESDNSVVDAGAAYVFTRTGTVWSQQAYLKAPNVDLVDLFGQSLSLSAAGDLLAIGSIGEDSAATGVNGNVADESRSNSGAVYLYERAGSTWSLQTYFKASNPDQADQFGYSIQLSASGLAMVVGARSEDSDADGVGGNQADNGLADAGAVYVFKQVAGVWGQTQYVKSFNSDANDAFGKSVAISSFGSTIAVGAPGESSTGVSSPLVNTFVDSGAAYVFDNSTASASQIRYLKGLDVEASDRFGEEVALSHDGRVLAVAIPNESGGSTGVGGNPLDNSAPNAGAVYLFE